MTISLHSMRLELSPPFPGGPLNKPGPWNIFMLYSKPGSRMTGCADCSKPQSVALRPWRCSESSLLTRMWWLGPLVRAGRVPTATTHSTFAHLGEGCLLWKDGLKKSSYLGKLGKAPLVQAVPTTLLQASQPDAFQPPLLLLCLGSTRQGTMSLELGGG